MTDLAPLGAHTSTAGGVSSALPRAAAIDATGMQIFTKTANQWNEPGIDAEERARFRNGVRDARLRFTVAHDSYLINLASPDPVLWTRSLISFTSELRRSSALELDAVVSHPGNFMDHRAEGIARNAAAITLAMEAVPGRPRLLMELTAGSGTAIGSSFEEMALLLGALPREIAARTGVCLDTAHVFAAGYDLVRDYDGVIRAFDDAIGLDRLGLLHLNDSKVPLGSRRDRHEWLGDGHLGPEPFRRLMTDDRLAAIPKIIETPKGEDAAHHDRRMLTQLRQWALTG